MKLRSMALAGAATLALSTPALAQNPGWYLGLGVGYDQLETVQSRTNTNPPTSVATSYSGDAIYLGSAGYKWDSGIRLELELGFDSHDASKAISAGSPAITKPALSGGTSTGSALLNFIYDWDFGNRWGLSLGGGVGAADVNHYERVSGAQAIQGIAGVLHGRSQGRRPPAPPSTTVRTGRKGRQSPFVSFLDSPFGGWRLTVRPAGRSRRRSIRHFGAVPCMTCRCSPPLAPP